MNPYLQELEALRARKAQTTGREAPQQGGTASNNQFLQELDTLRKAPKPKTYEKGGESALEDFAEGAVVSGMETWYGLKDLVGMMDDEDKKRLKDWQDDAAQSGWGMGGKIVGEIAQLAMPTGALGAGVKGGLKLSKLARAMKAAKAAAPALVHGYVKLPEAGETRAGNLAEEAAAGALTAGLGKVLTKGLRGLKGTKDAMKLTKQGHYLTPGQYAGKESGINTLEDLGGLLPGTAKGTKALRDEGIADWGKAAFQKVNPKGYPKITEIGHGGFEQLEKNVNKGYDDAWKGVEGMSKGKAESILDTVGKAEGKVDDVSTLKRVVADLGDISDGVSPSQLKTFDRALGDALGEAKGNAFLTKDLKKLRDMVRSSLPEENKKALRYMDSIYPDFLSVRKAADAARHAKGEFTPRQLMTALSMKAGEAKSARGARSLARDAYNQGINTVGQRKEIPMLSAIKNVSRGAPSPTGLMRSIGRGAIGETKAQKAALGKLRLLNKALDKRRLGGLKNPYSIGGALEELNPYEMRYFRDR